jgi:polyisoprenoid-binding protein YceI
MSPDFFDVDKFPEAILSIYGSEKTGEGYAFRAMLTIKGIQDRVEGTYTLIADDNKRYAVQGSLTFDRSKYNVRYGSASFFDNLGDDMIYDEVTLGFKIALVQ